MPERPASKKVSDLRILDSVHLGEESSEHKKRKKISRIITIVDASLVILLLIFFSTRDSNNSKTYATVSAASEDLLLRFSVNIDKETDNLIFSLTLRSGEMEKKLRLSGSVATLKLMHKGNVFYMQELGTGASDIALLPDEAKTFIAQVPAAIIDAYLSDTLPHRKKKSLFEFKDASETVTAEAYVNLINPVSVSIEFQREVPYD